MEDFVDPCYFIISPWLQQSELRRKEYSQTNKRCLSFVLAVTRMRFNPVRYQNTLLAGKSISKLATLANPETDS